MIPLRMIMSVAIIAAMSVMIAVGYQQYTIMCSEAMVTNDLSAFQAELTTLLASGVPRDVNQQGAGNGTIRVHTFRLPDSLVYLAFGVDPDPDNIGERSTGLCEDGAMMCFRVQGGSKHIRWVPHSAYRFREGIYADGTWVLNTPAQGHIVTQAGSHTLVVELVNHNGQLYLLLHATDQFTP